MLLKYTDNIGRLSLLNANCSPGATPFITFPNSSPPSLYTHGWRLGRGHFALCDAPHLTPFIVFTTLREWTIRASLTRGPNAKAQRIFLRSWPLSSSEIPEIGTFQEKGLFMGTKHCTASCVWTTETSTAEKQRPDRSTRGGEIKKIGRSPE